MKTKTDPTGLPRHDADFPVDDVMHWLPNARVVAESVALRVHVSRAEPDDLVQEAMAELVKCWHRYDPSKGGRSAWVTAVAWRGIVEGLRRGGCSRSVIRSPRTAPPAARPRCLNLAYRRAEGGTADVIDPEDVRLPDPGSVAESADGVATLLRDLTPRQRRALTLQVVHGLDHAAIAADLRVPIWTVNTTLAKARLRVLERFAGRPEYLAENYGVTK